MIFTILLKVGFHGGTHRRIAGGIHGFSGILQIRQGFLEGIIGNKGSGERFYYINVARHVGSGVGKVVRRAVIYEPVAGTQVQHKSQNGENAD